MQQRGRRHGATVPASFQLMPVCTLVIEERKETMSLLRKLVTNSYYNHSHSIRDIRFTTGHELLAGCKISPLKFFWFRRGSFPFISSFGRQRLWESTIKYQKSKYCLIEYNLCPNNA